MLTNVALLAASGKLRLQPSSGTCDNRRMPPQEFDRPVFLPGLIGRPRQGCLTEPRQNCLLVGSLQGKIHLKKDSRLTRRNQQSLEGPDKG
jgi:hypothetical protein